MRSVGSISRERDDRHSVAGSANMDVDLFAEFSKILTPVQDKKIESLEKDKEVRIY